MILFEFDGYFLKNSIYVCVRAKIKWAQKGFGLDKSPQRLIYRSEFLNQQLNFYFFVKQQLNLK